MPPFKPNPGDVLHLPCVGPGNENTSLPYTVQPSPLNKTIAYASQGGKAIIYRLYSDRGANHWALKVFNKPLRNEEIWRSCTRLTRLVSLPGFKAATRTVIAPSHNIVEQHRDLKWAVLMPWVTGRTCFDVFGIYIAANKKRVYQLPVGVAIAQARRLVEIESGLESKGYAHTDISSGNFVLDYDAQAQPQSAPQRVLDSQLIDIEDVWFPDIAGRSSFTDGYGHPSLREGATTACPEGDRYATTILTAELLLLTNHEFAKSFEAGGYFQDNRNNPDACRRYEQAQRHLKSLCPDFADALAQAWCSRTLSDCGRIVDLWATLKVKDGFVPPTPPGPGIGGLFGATPPLNASSAVEKPVSTKVDNVDHVYTQTPLKSVPPSKPVPPLSSPPPAPSGWAQLSSETKTRIVVVTIIVIWAILKMIMASH